MVLFKVIQHIFEKDNFRNKKSKDPYVKGLVFTDEEFLRSEIMSQKKINRIKC
ncbi:hypothetical protein BRARA_J02206 [Brassica rapa]|uniref:Uncharacterized protein n=1 Tax=Brassica campestris TaxID=3711 RepID=A0A397XV05_BRACM|nr:hypothetical protein BRARA_J02206 [Brassica rapa]RID42311.1 hypothetical protein BRARA_J02206 [Brassica rapa]